MANKPNLPLWIPNGEAARITDPGLAKRDLGFVYQEKPPFQYFNWALYNLSQWQLGLQGSYFDIIVGSSAQVTANEATNVIADLDDTLVLAGSRVMILDGTHTLLANLALANADIMIVGESPLAIIAVSTFQMLMTGARQQINLRVTGAGANDVQVSAAGTHFEGIDIDIASVQVTNGATARTSGILGGVKISTGAISDNIMMARKTSEDFTGQKNFSPSAALTWGANVAWNLNTQQVANLTLTGVTAQLDNPTNIKDGGTYAIRISQDATGGRALTFGTNYKWVNGSAPTIPQGINEYMWISFFGNGTVMDGVGQGPFS